ncbi:hypothetical protein BDZ91DRAFT_251825 [Kalaharituber pfeilii]|nr:hypothetical protein BDZ91DRAFT_251825 [Kalaharituber pfeilii]
MDTNTPSPSTPQALLSIPQSSPNQPTKHSKVIGPRSTIISFVFFFLFSSNLPFSAFRLLFIGVFLKGLFSFTRKEDCDRETSRFDSIRLFCLDGFFSLRLVPGILVPGTFFYTS